MTNSELTTAAVASEPAVGKASSSNGDGSRDGFEPGGLRVLHVIDRLSLGGTPNLLMRSVKELSRRGVQSQVCVLTSEQQTDDEYRQQVEPIYLGFEGEYRNPWALSQCVRRLRTVIDDVRPDVVHSYLWVSDYVSALANHRRGAAHISHVVDRRDWQASDRLVHRLRRWATRRAFRRAGTRFVAVSQAAKEFACQHMDYAPDNVAVAANGIDCEQFAGRSDRTGSDGPLMLGTAGRLAEEKGHRFLIDAMALLVERGGDVRLKVTGEGPLRDELASLVKRRGLTQHVEFVGWVPDVGEFYQAIDLFVVPSVTAEGLPTTILEAMASGCVVVASDVGGAGEAIRDSVDGHLVPAGDARALSDRIEPLLNDAGSLSRMAASARTRVRDHFTTERMVDVIGETYQTALRAKGTR